MHEFVLTIFCLSGRNTVCSVSVWQHLMCELSRSAKGLFCCLTEQFGGDSSCQYAAEGWAQIQDSRRYFVKPGAHREYSKLKEADS